MKKKNLSRILLCILLLTCVFSFSKSVDNTGKVPSDLPVCENCGKETLHIVSLETVEVGPRSVPCTDGYPYGDDLEYTQQTICQYQCKNCPYKSSTWLQTSGTSAKCHGYY